jgi:SAM-dependent methyltransferase
MSGIRGPMAELYDVFVDWPGRLGREMPGLKKHLRAVDARRVLDVGCGTAQHVAALRDEGLDAEGADASEEMLQRAVVSDGLHHWRLGEPPPLTLKGPFDAVVCLGNVWPQLNDLRDVDRALARIHTLLRPGGLLLIGMKAFAPRRRGNNPYLPLLRREVGGEPVYFIRFLDPGEGEIAGFHMVIARGEESHHRTGEVRVWSAGSLKSYVAERGYGEVVVTAGIDGPPADEETEDVFLRGFA